ncbi:unnamed protein product [Nyctereutes procyonoides]|uniref:Selenoprotein S n=1 Tax=Nyctereutes procyonoides TaxID=34880 RepID=A0A811YBM9_NYCPR|nr:unnamed protein product [Nyctereutes procyonoides]
MEELPFLHHTVLRCLLLSVMFQKLSTQLRALRQRQLDSVACLKMQEELNAPVKNKRRRQKIEMWGSMQEGKRYKVNIRKPPEEDHPGLSISSLGGSYKPLFGEGSEACSWRPGQRPIIW